MPYVDKFTALLQEALDQSGKLIINFICRTELKSFVSWAIS